MADNNKLNDDTYINEQDGAADIQTENEDKSPENCDQDCSSCGADCPSRGGGIEQAALNEHSSIKKVIGVVSGKGGVGKSMVTALSALAATRHGFKTGIMDADITGPSIPKMFGIHEKAAGSEFGLLPALTPMEIKIMSINLLTENETDPVVWRGPVIGGVVTQFWTDVLWEDLDVLFIDMPPGTGDVPLTVFQSIPIDGIIVVTSPQDLVSMIVAKAVNMARLMNIPALGLVENMSYFECPDCGGKHEIFGKSKAEEVAVENGVKLLERLPINPTLSEEADLGKIEFNEGTEMESILGVLDSLGLKA